MWFFFFFPSTSHVYDFSKNQLKKILEKNQLVIMVKLNFLQKEKIISNVRSNFSLLFFLHLS